MKAVLGVFGRLGSITASAGPIITTPEPVLAKLENSAGQEQLNERGGIVVAAIRGATHAHGRANTWLTRNCNIRAALLGWRLLAAPPIKKIDMQKVQVKRDWSKGRTADLRDGRQALSPLGQRGLAMVVICVWRTGLS